MASKHAWKVDLTPWDQRSTEQVNRLYEQRLSCGWGSDEVLTDEVPEREALLVKHTSKYPKEASPLIDTTTEVCLIPRVPSKKQFIPIGHIALAINSSDDDEKLRLPRSGVIWVRRLYISYVLQGEGFGAAAMAKAEQLAALEPLNGSIIALDTVAKEIHKNKELQRLEFDARGLPRPNKTNEEWYIRLGYEIFERAKNGREFISSGGVVLIEIIYFKKTLR